MTPLEAGRTIADRYRLERVLARGGMGSLWVARHIQLDIDVAIKFMAPECAASPEARVRFEREAKASALFKSPNVVLVHDYGIADDTPYIVMELLQGEDLDARLKREGRLSLPATAVILVQACKALRRAHEVGFIHRDIKPGNLFLSRQDDEETLKILDFGIVKSTGALLASASTKSGSLVGSPHYMSPEQVHDCKQINHRSDLWSLGVVAFRCLTGELPFPGDALGSLLMAICADPIPIPSQIAKGLGPAVDRFFERALARDPDQRFQSAREFAEALFLTASLSGQGFGRKEMGSLSPTSAPPLVTAPRAPAEPRVEPASAPPPAESLSSERPAPIAAPAPAPLASGRLTPEGQTIALSSGVHHRGPLALVAGGVGFMVLGVVGLTLSRAPARGESPNERLDPASPSASAAPAPAKAASLAAPPLVAPRPQETDAKPAASSGRRPGGDRGSTSVSSLADAGAPLPVKRRAPSWSDAGRPSAADPSRPETKPDDPLNEM